MAVNQALQKWSFARLSSPYFKLGLALIAVFILVEIAWTHQSLGQESFSKLYEWKNKWSGDQQSSSSSSNSNNSKADISNFFRYGRDRCYSPFSYSYIRDKALKMSNSCAQHSPEQSDKLIARIGTVTAQFGDVTDPYQRALQSHQVYSLVHGSPLHVQCTSVVDTAWNKPHLIQNILFNELGKAKEDRLDWLFWADADTIILDQCRKLDSFLPPNNNDTVHMLVAKDWNGLNAGVFFVRVSSWSLALFTAMNAYPFFNPNTKLDFAEQTALALTLEHEQFRNNVTFVPQHFFNTYVNDDRDYTATEGLEGLQSHQARRGDFLVHFAGHGKRLEAMAKWLKMIDAEGNIWATAGRAERNLSSEIKTFWGA